MRADHLAVLGRPDLLLEGRAEGVAPCRLQPTSPPRALLRVSSEAALATAAKASPFLIRSSSAWAFFSAAAVASAEAPLSTLTRIWRSLRSLGAFS